MPRGDNDQAMLDLARGIAALAKFHVLIHTGL